VDPEWMNKDDLLFSEGTPDRAFGGFGFNNMRGVVAS
jgi:hypothetical protein